MGISKGQDMVRVSFNPNEDVKVTDIKTKMAEAIDLLESFKNERNGREISIAQTQLQTASMFGVLAVNI